MPTLRQRTIERVRAWSFKRHGQDTLPITVNRRRIYILPTRMGFFLGFSLIAMLLAGLNYNSNLGLAFAFLLVSMTLVIMHHCNRNLVRLSLDATTEIDAFAGGNAGIEFVLRNNSKVERRDVEVRCADASAIGHVQPEDLTSILVLLPVASRGVQRIKQVVLRTRYPFGWFYSWTYVHRMLTVYIAPEPKGNRTLPLAEGLGNASIADTPGDEEFSGLQPYRPGMPLKHMAWKVLARGGEAAVRTYSGLGSQPEWLDWNYLEGMSDEARLSQLCQWLLESDAAHRSYGLRLPGLEIAPSGGAAHRFACLRALASYGEQTA
jgi:uncharacterized protein (DUF58 family)